MISLRLHLFKTYLIQIWMYNNFSAKQLLFSDYVHISSIEGNITFLLMKFFKCIAVEKLKVEGVNLHLLP